MAINIDSEMFSKIRQEVAVYDLLSPLVERIGQRVKLAETGEDDYGEANVSNNTAIRVCLLTGLSLSCERNKSDLEKIELGPNHFHQSLFFTNNMQGVYAALIKLRYHNVDVDWNSSGAVSRIIANEIHLGLYHLMQNDNLERMLMAVPEHSAFGTIPALDLEIGVWAGTEQQAKLDINSNNINNSQILVAGASGSGKTNLLMTIIHQFRSIAADTRFPVNFLLFDYKGEYSDPANSAWLSLLDVSRSCILNPVEKPLPFNPFKDFTDRPINEINLYSTEMASSLCALSRATVSANMGDRLSRAIVEAYRKTRQKPITFAMMLEEYRLLAEDGQGDSITSILNQLVTNNLFSNEDKADLLGNSFIIQLGSYPQDGPLAKAIVYFLMSKLNNIYENTPPQEKTEERVQIRHFSIIDEAHHMLKFDNRPLRRLIVEGRNKGMSIILATQNMAEFKSDYFDFYANAEYPLIMRQQSIDDKVLKDLFGVGGRDLQDLKESVTGLQKGELIIKNQTGIQMGIGKRWKKIIVNKLI